MIHTQTQNTQKNHNSTKHNLRLHSRGGVFLTTYYSVNMQTIQQGMLSTKTGKGKYRFQRQIMDGSTAGQKHWEMQQKDPFRQVQC